MLVVAPREGAAPQIDKQELSMSKSNGSTLRDYDAAEDSVKELYRKSRTNQTIESVTRARTKYGALPDSISALRALELLSTYVDVSDPDMSLPNDLHLYQTADAIRADGHPDWMQVVGLIHDVGKCLYLKGCDEDGTSKAEQWAIVGDTFVLGEPLPDCLVYPEFNKLNPDCDARIYEDGCGLDNCLVSYGHDEFLYQMVIQSEEHKIPPEGLAMIRYHSLYAWHTGGAYTRLENDHDRKMKPWVQLFNKYDLYPKSTNVLHGKTANGSTRVYATGPENGLPPYVRAGKVETTCMTCTCPELIDLFYNGLCRGCHRDNRGYYKILLRIYLYMDLKF